jgi:hypothetical protein
MSVIICLEELLLMMMIDWSNPRISEQTYMYGFPSLIFFLILPNSFLIELQLQAADYDQALSSSIAV